MIERSYMGAGVLYMDGKKVCNAESVKMEFTTEDPPHRFNPSISGSITINGDIGGFAGRMFRAYMRAKVKRIVNLCNNNWRRRHGLPLIRKGSAEYHFRKMVKEWIKKWRILWIKRISSLRL